MELVVVADVAVLYSGRPLDVVDAVDALQEGGQAFQSVGNFRRDQIEIDASDLLEVSELRDFEAVQHDLPAYAPCSERRVFPVVLFELEIVLAEVDADRFEAAHVLVDHVGGRGLQDHLKLHVLVEAVGVVAVTSVGGTAAGLHVGGAVRLRPERAQEGFGAGCARADFDVVRLLDDAAAVAPIALEVENDFLKSHAAASSTGKVMSLRSICVSICWARKRRRSAAVFWVHGRLVSWPMGVWRISSAMARDSGESSQVPRRSRVRRQSWQ